MKIRNTIAIFGISLLVSGLAAAGHHENSGAVMPAASSGQLIAVYHWPCADAEKGMSLLKEMIAYESQHSPIPYSATPAIHEDGALVSVDIHSSAASLEQAQSGKTRTRNGKRGLRKWPRLVDPQTTCR
jgi:hypothetical protein